jgi:hypothetical protein
MAKYRGKVQRSDLEGGHWQLVGDDGTTYVLEADAAGSLDDGARYEVDGTVDRNALSIAMTGPVLRAKSVRRM